ncbi:MAG: bifunctional riboflavin kinase/FAD synthetase [Deltaproteobacteria bacterium]|nr:MAG: bifunctional riboflavin kinase/FAD synthetase [Deltaproteobacteria bacterium]
MNVYWDLDQLPEEPLEPIMTMGNLDGVHRGHQIIISHIQQEAERVGAPTLVVTFEPHTRRVVRPDSGFRTVMTTREKLRRLQELGVDHVLVLPFREGYSEMTALEFIDEVLWEPLKARSIFVGPDAGYGKGREGDVRLLSSEGRRLGFHVGVIDPLYVEGHRISSSLIRRAIENGNLERANRLLGRHHIVSGTVMRGFRRGRELGYPTANIADEGVALPPFGVYAGWAFTEAGERYGTMINIGERPTFDGQSLSIEAHLFDFDGNLYGRELRVSLRHHLRAEAKFEDAAALKAQMMRDAVEARKLLGIKKGAGKAKAKA